MPVGELEWEEIADIGVMVFARRETQVIARKIALLQSKRLYPLKHGLTEETMDVKLSAQVVLSPAWHCSSPTQPYRFDFTDQSKYQALKIDERQYKAISLNF
jgi:hypothetical protein